MPPQPTPTPGLDPFYERFLDAGGILFASSGAVPETALAEAASIIDNMLEGRDDIRTAIIGNGGRVGIIGAAEATTDIPEHRFLKNDPNVDWDTRARGFGGTLFVPVTTAAEENLLCLDGDVYAGQSILVHEFAHTIQLMGLPFVDGGPALLARVEAAYASARTAGLWDNTYAGSNVEEYWATGVQSWFGASFTVPVADGVYNHVGDRTSLTAYDPVLAGILADTFHSSWRHACPV